MLEFLKLLLSIFLPASKPVLKSGPKKISDLTLIKKYEGLRLFAYLPTVNDRWTIGYGHTEGVYRGQVITKEQADKFLAEDVAWVETTLLRWVKVPLTQNQFDALGSLVYNIGEPQFASSTLLKKLNTKDYNGAALEFLRWNKQKKKVLRGLTKRRQEEMELFQK